MIRNSASVQAGGTPPPPALAVLVSEAVEAHRRATGEDEYEAIWPVLDEARAYEREALDSALALLGSGDASERAVGCDLLGTLCNPDDQSLGPEVASVLIRLAACEEDTDVLWSIARTFAYAKDPRALPTLARLAEHPDSDVRFQVALALPPCEEGGDLALLATALISLMGDEEEQVRDWATFGLGTQTDIDGPDVRDALVSRLSDVSSDTRDEAIVGLARRHDRRALPVVAGRLGENEVSRLPVEAATYLHDERLLLPMRALKTWWDLDPELLDEAIAACNPEQQARALDEQSAFLGQLEAALADRPEVCPSLSCERLGGNVVLEVSEGGRTVRYDFRALTMKRAGGDLTTAVSIVVSEIQGPERGRNDGSLVS